MATDSETARVDATKATMFFGFIGGIVAFDFFTKWWIQQNFHLYQQVQVVGDYVRLTFIYNPGAAFGIHLGSHSRIIFLVLSFTALLALAAMFWATPKHDRTRLAAIAAICGGAIGNLLDRIRSAQGVVDFMDIGIGDIRWPVFNVADIAVTAGAIFLAVSLWREETADDEYARGG